MNIYCIVSSSRHIRVDNFEKKKKIRHRCVINQSKFSSNKMKNEIWAWFRSTEKCWGRKMPGKCNETKKIITKITTLCIFEIYGGTDYQIWSKTSYKCVCVCVWVGECVSFMVSHRFSFVWINEQKWETISARKIFRELDTKRLSGIFFVHCGTIYIEKSIYLYMYVEVCTMVSSKATAMPLWL